MQEKVVTLDWNYKEDFLYLLDKVRDRGLIYGDMVRGDRRELYVAIREESDHTFLSDCCEEVLLTSFKWRYFSEYVSSYIKTVEDKALLFALLDFDSQGEREYFLEKIYPLDSVHLDAHYNFGMSHVKNVWEGYVDLIRDFYLHRPDSKEKLELTAYMITVNRRNRKKRGERYYLFHSKQDKILQNIFYYHEKTDFFPEDCLEASKIVKKIFG